MCDRPHSLLQPTTSEAHPPKPHTCPFRRLEECEGPEYGKTFLDIRSIPELWDWLDGGLLNTIFPDTEWYNGDSVDPRDLNEAGFIFLYNKPTSGFELIQTRVLPIDACQTNPEYCGFYPTVWPGWDSAMRPRHWRAVEDTHSFGPPWNPKKYQWIQSDTGALDGYQVPFVMHRTRAELQLRELQKDRWIDKQTRQVKAIISVFNANVRLFAVVTLSIDFGETGQLAPDMQLRSLRLESFVEVRA